MSIGPRENATRLLGVFTEAMEALGEWADNPNGYDGEDGIELWLNQVPALMRVREAMKTYALNERQIVLRRTVRRD